MRSHQQVLSALCVTSLWLALGCVGSGSRATDSGHDTGNPHFLEGCYEIGCGVGLQCVCGVCTRPCVGYFDCKDLSNSASCEGAGTPSDACMYPTAQEVCDVHCFEDSNCASLGSDYSCVSGSCRKMGASGCTRDGIYYKHGGGFGLGCQRCMCMDGTIDCTGTPCIDGGNDGSVDAAGDSSLDASTGNNDSGSPDGTCTIGAITYADGSAVHDPQSCNTCTCIGGRVDLCTEINCPLPACHLLHEISWFEGPSGNSVRHSVDRAGVYTRFTASGAVTCSDSVPACPNGSGELDQAALNAALLHPHVVEALRVAPVTYGVPANGGGGRFIVDGRTVTIDATCIVESCGVPAGIGDLFRMLTSVGLQQFCPPTN